MPIVDDVVHKGLILQEDGAGAHACSEYLKNKGVQVMPAVWPARSPQLSVIEDLWAILQRRVAEHHPMDRDSMIQALQHEWDALSDEEIHNLIMEFPNRVRKCANGGGDV